MKEHKISPSFSLSGIRSELMIKSKKQAGPKMYTELRNRLSLPINFEVYQKIGFHVYHQLVIHRGRDYEE